VGGDAAVGNVSVTVKFIECNKPAIRRHLTGSKSFNVLHENGRIMLLVA
jgi:hypothetical protein